MFYTIWSDVFICPSCSGEINYWNEAVEKDTQKLKAEFSCPHCGINLTKRGLERSWETVFDGNINSTVKRAKQTPVAVNLKHGSNRMEREAEHLDIELLKSIDSYSYDGFYPIDKLPFGYNTAQPVNSHGITHVHHLYTRRSLLTLSKFYQLVNQSNYRNNLLALLTGVAFATTKLYRWTPNYEGGGPLSGTYYIPALYREISVLDALKRFGDKLPKNMGFTKKKGNTIISVDSATTIQIPDNSIDYIFVDPPFGGNIMYSELNFLWESWLKVKTNNKDEAIINEKHDKQIYEYRKLMESSFANFYRALKPGKWITVEFSNSQASIWNAIRESIERAGFIIANVSALDKKQGSFKAITTTTAVKQDLVISAYKPKSEFVDNMLKQQNSEESAWLFIEQHLQQLPVFVGGKGAAELIVERTPRILFDRMIAYHVQHSLPVPISSADFQLGVEQRFPMRDGMAFLEEQVAEYDKKRTLAKEFTQLTLFVSDENSAIEWLRQQLLKRPQTRQDLHPNYMKEIQHIAKHEELPELDALLEQNFLKYDGQGEVPTQLLRSLSKNDPGLKLKAKERWYVPDPNKQADLEKLREKSLLREFETYRDGLNGNRKKLKQFRTEAIRAGFKKAWGEKDYQTIVTIGERLPENVLQEDDKLLMYYDNAQIRLGL
ncbi:DNA methyltransferase [Paenibacillus sp. RC67]|uniref:DNA methyltransferase n=1 Tax=Paenibacillus sp. RC67 TaxID=3039392 RepID=UPI0024ACB4DD|nr:DNA methyltransferase [Paenibacillus sp. RC67]